MWTLTQRLETGRQAYACVYVNMGIVNLHMHALAGIVVEGLIPYSEKIS